MNSGSLRDFFDSSCQIIIEFVFDFCCGRQCWCICSNEGAYALMRVTGPTDEWSFRDRILSLPTVGGTMDLSRVFLAAKPTPCSLVSFDGFPCQKNEKFFFFDRSQVWQSHLLQGNNVHLQSTQFHVDDSCLVHVVYFLQVVRKARGHCPNLGAQL